MHDKLMGPSVQKRSTGRVRKHCGREFILNDEACRKKVFLELGKHFTVRTDNPRKIRRTLFDTFDWRLYASGQRLEEVRYGDSVRAEWRDNASGEVLGSTEGPVPPTVCKSEQALFGGALEGVLKMRALLPLGMLHTLQWPAALLDEYAQEVAYISVDINSTGSVGRRAGKTAPHVIRLSPVRGRHKAFGQAAVLIENIAGTSVAVDDLLKSVFSANGRTPLDYTAKINVPFSAGVTAEEAVRTVLGRLAEIMEANVSGIIAGIDTEFLHDFRVAVRRTRSMLGQMKAAVPEEILEEFKPEFDRLGAITGPTRDLDVFILKYDDYVAPLEQSLREDLAPLKEHITRQQQLEQQKLASALSARRYRLFIKGWKNVLRSAWQSNLSGWRGGEEAAAVVGRRILKIHRRALSRGAAIKNNAPATAIHELRITCKKLRYMLEFFKNLFSPPAVELLTKALRELQDSLGDFQDYQVHHAALYRFAGEMTEQKNVSLQTMLAIGRLAERLSVCQLQARPDISRRFAAFAAHRNTLRFRHLFKAAAHRFPSEEEANR